MNDSLGVTEETNALIGLSGINPEYLRNDFFHSIHDQG